MIAREWALPGKLISRKSGVECEVSIVLIRKKNLMQTRALSMIYEMFSKLGTGDRSILALILFFFNVSTRNRS